MKTGQISYTCEQCSKIFFLYPSRAKYGRGKFCSTACKNEWMKVIQKRGATVERICQGCNNTFTLLSSKIRNRWKGGGKYCSRECRDANRIRDKHPQWLGGPDGNRGPDWQAQRRKALKRDNHTCQHCGNQGEAVHHIKPFRIFGLERYKEANRLSNLITLCESCHRKADAAIQRNAVLWQLA